VTDVAARRARELRGFTRSLPMSLLKAREAVMRRFVPTLRAHDLSPQQWRVLRALEAHGDLDLTRLSEETFLMAPSLTRIVQRLSERDLVRRRAHPADQRRAVVALTGRGRRLFEKIAPLSEARYEDIAARFGPGKLELLYELLDELVEKLADEPANGDAREIHEKSPRR